MRIEVRCRVCGKIFIDDVQRRDRAKRYCSEECKKKLRAMPSDTRPKTPDLLLYSERTKQLRLFTCKVCQKPFYSEGRYAKFCSKDCRTANYLRGWDEAKKQRTKNIKNSGLDIEYARTHPPMPKEDPHAYARKQMEKTIAMQREQMIKEWGELYGQGNDRKKSQE